MKSVRLDQVREAERRYLATRLGRRRMIAALGLSAAAAPVVLRDAGATSGPGGEDGHAGHLSGAVQEGSPPAEATPQLGARPDGTSVWKVVAGGGAPEEGIDLLAFLPSDITVNVGDAIWWENRGFHNVHFLSGASVPPVFVPDPTAGTPAAGPPQVILNPEVAFPAGSTTYDGAGVVNSGAPLDPTAPPFVLTFTAPGAFDYYCTIHGETMKGTVTVQEAGSAYPMDQAAVDAAGMAEAEALLEQGRSLIAEAGAAVAPPMDGPANHRVIAGLSAPKLEVNVFLPRELRIKAGDVVQWVNEATEPPVPHTVTLLGERETPAFIIPESQAGGPPKLVINPELAAPSAPQIPDGYGGAAFANSGILGGDPNAPLAFELLFDSAGTYRYYCAVHGDPEGGMVGDVIVEAAG